MRRRPNFLLWYACVTRRPLRVGSLTQMSYAVVYCRDMDAMATAAPYTVNSLSRPA
jgi:hypothetical protein